MLLRISGLFALAALDVLNATNAALVLLVSGWIANIVALVLVGVMPTRGGAAMPLIKFGVQAVPAQFANLANSRLDQALIVPLLGSAELGIYAVAVGSPSFR